MRLVYCVFGLGRVSTDIEKCSGVTTTFGSIHLAGELQMYGTAYSLSLLLLL